MEFNFTIKNDKLTSTAYPKGVTGNVNTYTCRVNIESDIAGIISFCIIKQGDNVYNQIIEDNTCVMPYEVLTSAEPLYIGCYGTNGDDDIKRVSTNFICFDVKQGAYSEADAPETPTPDIWESLINKNIPYIGDNGNWFIYDVEQKTYVDSGNKSQGEKGEQGIQGEKGEQGIQGEKGDKGKDGYTPIRGVDYWTEADQNQISTDLDKKIANKVDKVAGKGLSTNDYTNTDKAEVAKVKDKVGLTDYATDTKAGVVKVESIKGIKVGESGEIGLNVPNETAIAQRLPENSNLPITIGNLDYAVRSVRPEVSYNPPLLTSDTYKVNTIYSLDSISNVNITLPSDAQCGDFIQVDFYTANKTTLSITSNAGISDVDLTPELNTAYSLYFDWGILYYNTSKSEYVFGWRFSYAEYPHKEV